MRRQGPDWHARPTRPDQPRAAVGCERRVLIRQHDEAPAGGGGEGGPAAGGPVPADDPELAVEAHRVVAVGAERRRDHAAVRDEPRAQRLLAVEREGAAAGRGDHPQRVVLHAQARAVVAQIEGLAAVLVTQRPDLHPR